MKKIFKTITLLAILALVGQRLSAQNNEIPKVSQSFEANIGFGDGTTGSLSWNRTHGLFQSKKIRIGYGLRLSAFGGNNLEYITAPANLTKNNETIDTLIVESPLTMGLSAVIHIEYMLSSKLKLGFNIDALGLGFGRESDARFVSSESSEFPANLTAKPTSYNVLLIGDNDIGQLKSEFFLAYRITDPLWLKAGLDMTFSEYTTDRLLTHENDRFRYKAMLFFVGIAFSPVNR
ncbi:MAG: hypothetical protein JJU28_05655 [Cyclobacteriaceae bacterium]|nr:hypothetical protein [Cyclobacteriaceae bacterium]